MIGHALHLLAIAQTEGMLERPDDHSVDGHRIDWLVSFTNVWIVILFAIMAVWLFAAVILHREKRHTAEYQTGERPKDWVVGLGVASFVFLVVDGTLFTKSSLDMSEVFWNFSGHEADPGVVRIEINGRQWLWEARYAGPDNEFATADDIVTLNDVRVPQGRPVVMQIGAADIVHNLYIPHLRVKQDAMPGTINRAYFKAKDTGKYEIACAQHCGVNHYLMKAHLTVMENDAYERWAARASRDSQAIYDPEDTEAHWGWAWIIR